MQVGELYHSQEHGLIVIRKVTPTHQSMAGTGLYLVEIQVLAEGTAYSANMMADYFHVCFKSLSL